MNIVEFNHYLITPPNSITVKWDEKSQAMAIPHRLCVCLCLCPCLCVCVCLSVCRYFIYVKYPSTQKWHPTLTHVVDRGRSSPTERCPTTIPQGLCHYVV